MPFQFMCPQGHLLEGVESMMGQQSQCPLCGALFVVPVVSPPPVVPDPAAQPGYYPPAYPGAPYSGAGYAPQPPAPAGFYPPATPVPGPENPFAAGPAPAAAPAAPAEPAPAVAEPVAEKPATPEEPRVVRILCPNSHELHTPMDMIGQEALCPECGAQFRLRYEDSLEYAEERRAAQARRDEAFNKGALKWSIVAAVVVVLALIVMIVISSCNRS
jgi:hypothetical protein